MFAKEKGANPGTMPKGKRFDRGLTSSARETRRACSISYKSPTQFSNA